MNSAIENRMTIGRLARHAGVGIDTIRFYERRGLLPEPARTPAGYRLYPSQAAARLRFIRRAKGLGFTLDEIEWLLELQDVGGQKSIVKDLTRKKLSQIDSKIEDLSRIHKVLSQLESECSGSGDVSGCPIIAALALEET
ncbi:MAG: MerR family transcriptional regulator [Arenicellales bacterium]|jgi:Hg(II)-responsive transcriptional regulator|nr:MerR family transcriptional regulator [Arenicellales bacterium]|tara:strand:- start:135 stop:554 length:420 start_codon:yes stop_codon:yes gene_type:complete